MNSIWLAISILAGFTFERLLHAIVYSLIFVLFSSNEKYQGIMAMRVSTGFFNVIFSIFVTIFSVIVQVFTWLIQWIITVFSFLLLSTVLYIIFQHAIDFMFESGITYNKSLGPLLQIVIVWPLEILTWFYNNLIPLWNAFIFLMKKIPSELLLQTVTHNLGILIEALQSLGSLAVSLVFSFLSWLQSFQCCSETLTAFCNQRCFDTGERIFDLLTPMAHFRNFVAWIVKWLQEMCYIASGPMDIITFPIMDINFAKFVHFFINSLLYTVFHVPAVTLKRCVDFGVEGAIMCVPDFDPVFFMLTSSFHYLGLCIDNWLDILILVVEGTLGRPTPKCTSVPSLLRDFDFKTSTFGTNKTIIVGMTEHMFARTDGNSVQYFSLDKDWQTIIHPNAFPFDVNLAYGVAPIAHFANSNHDTKGDDTTSLLGCKCGYGSEGVTIQCGVAMFTDDVSPNERIIPMSFQLPSTSQLIQCNNIVIRVESVRWPVSRFTATRIQRVDGTYVQDVGCATKNTCLQV
jgi:hypothetical protein